VDPTTVLVSTPDGAAVDLATVGFTTVGFAAVASTMGTLSLAHPKMLCTTSDERTLNQVTVG
jgi:hypothetical protein